MFFGTIKPKIIFNEYIINKITSETGISPFLVELVFDSGFIFMVFEYILADGIKHIINAYSRVEKKQYMLALSDVLRDFHTLGFVHRDVKPQNFLYHKQSQRAFLIDFGLSEYSPTRHVDFGRFSSSVQRLFSVYLRFVKKHLKNKHKMGTDGYLAPEVHFSQKHEICYKTDLWSLGSILMQLYFKKEFVFTQKMIVLDSKQMRLKNIKHSRFVLILQLAALLGTRTVEEYLNSIQIETRLPRVIEAHDLSSVMYFW